MCKGTRYGKEKRQPGSPQAQAEQRKGGADEHCLGTDCEGGLPQQAPIATVARCLHGGGVRSPYANPQAASPKLYLQDCKRNNQQAKDACCDNHLGRRIQLYASAHLSKKPFWLCAAFLSRMFLLSPSSVRRRSLTAPGMRGGSAMTLKAAGKLDDGRRKSCQRPGH